MTLKDAIDCFAGMSKTQQIRFLALYAHELTIVSRDTYEPGTEELRDPRRLRQLNEVQHRVVGHLAKLLADDTRRYPDDVLVAIIVEEGDTPLLQAFQRALRLSC